jgi:hypothetical protein
LASMAWRDMRAGRACGKVPANRGESIRVLGQSPHNQSFKPKLLRNSA